MDLPQLRAFIAVARTGNLTRAAEQLNLSQPAVSLQIKSLQATLGLRLFTRTAAGMALTAEAASLLPHAERVMAALQDMRQVSRSLNATVSGTLAVGTILDPEFIRLGPFLKRLVEQYPQISTQLQHGMSGTVLQRVRAGTVDVGYYLGAPGPECHAMTLTSFRYKVIAPAGWQARIAGLDWSGLAALPWIWTPEASAHNRLLSAVFEERGIVPNKVALVDQEPSMLDLVKSGVGLSLARESIALRESHAHGLAIADAVELKSELSFITQARRRHEPVIAAIFALLEGLWAW